MTSFLNVLCSKNEAVDCCKYSSKEWSEKQRKQQQQQNKYYLQDNLKSRKQK